MPGAANVEKVSVLAAAMRQRDRAIESLKSEAVMAYRAGQQHVKAREMIIARRPADLRVEARSPFGVALIVAVDGSQLAIFEPGKNVLMHGSADAAALYQFARIPMAPAAAVGLLMGLAPDADRLAAPGAVRDENGMIVLSYTGADGTNREAGFVNDQLTPVRARDVTGSVSYEVRYSDYHDIGGVTFPYIIEASFPAAGSSLKLTYERPIVNGAMADSLFILKPAAVNREIDLDHPAPASPE
jgi:hypothetical protein